MNPTIHETHKGKLTHWAPTPGERINTMDDFLDILASSPSPTIVLDAAALPEAFFELRSGIAGEFLQKISTYRRRLAILGDFTSTKSRALRDFIYESNATGQVVFAPSMEEAIALLR